MTSTKIIHDAQRWFAWTAPDGCTSDGEFSAGNAAIPEDIVVLMVLREDGSYENLHSRDYYFRDGHLFGCSHDLEFIQQRFPNAQIAHGKTVGTKQWNKTLFAALGGPLDCARVVMNQTSEAGSIA